MSRFPSLAIGEAFRWKGTRYTKTGPMTASDAAGHTRMIPRSASIEPVAPGEGPSADTSPAPDIERALAVLSEPLTELARTLDPTTADRLQTALNEGRAAFWRILENSHPGSGN